ncbi:unnamed protein product [Didymodactylos carnosus]|uniref:Reverse transcriptase domain-containing protein n=1 Tax=Didymodactylos carnosus TaxID=1234261 RepID=A0A8S2FFU6_9BILA|nr:unnamed protein product [Didymodactylos carnosus]CAF4250280.1 unnamed protein product [Didymodactylos carnosus]
MNQILSDSLTFQEINDDPTITKEDQLTRKLLQLKNAEFITEEEYEWIRSVGSQPGHIYRLPKVHKSGNPLRPIVSAIHTYNYKLSLLLARKLEHLRKSDIILLDTFSFVNELHQLKLGISDVTMISFDVVSLFTKVSLARTIAIILDKMYHKRHTCMFGNMKREF